MRDHTRRVGARLPVRGSPATPRAGSHATGVSPNSSTRWVFTICCELSAVDSFQLRRPKRQVHLLNKVFEDVHRISGPDPCAVDGLQDCAEGGLRFSLAHLRALAEDLRPAAVVLPPKATHTRRRPCFADLQAAFLITLSTHSVSLSCVKGADSWHDLDFTFNGRPPRRLSPATDPSTPGGSGCGDRCGPSAWLHAWHLAADHIGEMRLRYAQVGRRLLQSHDRRGSWVLIIGIETPVQK